MDVEKISRIEIIGNGREYVCTDALGVKLLLQDDGRTLKIFLSHDEVVEEQVKASMIAGLSDCGLREILLKGFLNGS